MKTIAIIGASYLQLPIVLKAKEMGLRVICFMWDKEAVCKEYADKFYPLSVIEKEKILKVCQLEKIDAITSIASDLVVPTINYVADKMGLVSNPMKYSDITTNKYLMRQCFADNNIPSPKFVIADEMNTHLICGFHFPLIVKPTDRSGSQGVGKVLDPVMLDRAIARAKSISFEKKAIVEEFITGREISVESISYQGKHYIPQITDKVTTGAPYFVELEHHQPSSLSALVKEQMKEIVLKALDALHIVNGASHSELKITENNEIKVIEIGARMGGDFIGSDLVQLSTGYDFVRGVIEVALGEFTEPKFTQHKYSGVYFLSKNTEYVMPYIINAVKYPEIVKAELLNDSLRMVECSGDRNGYCIYQNSEGKFNLKQ